MNDVWLISYGILWVLVASLCLAVVVLARQIGMILRRVGIPSARMVNFGPKVGDIVPELNAVSLTGQKISLGGTRGKKSLLVFVATSCPTCDDLMPSVKRVWKSEKRKVDTIIISLNNDELKNLSFIEKHDLQDIPFVASRELAVQYQVLSPPYGLVIDESNVLRAKGIVNNIDHLESLLNAAEMDVPSIESYMKKTQKSEAVSA